VPRNTWILCGKPENWNIAFQDGIWALVPKFGGKWRYIRENDRLFFYATATVAGMIGFGKVQTKFKQTKPLFPEEIAAKMVLYPFCFEFITDYALAESQWKTGRIKIGLPTGSYSGMNLLDDQDIIDKIIEATKKNWNTAPSEDDSESSKPQAITIVNVPVQSSLSHDKVKDMVYQIGKMHRYMADKEYVINSDKLDVVWRRVEKSVPTYAFEIQVSGNLHQAIAKLKHAYDIWNSNIFLVTEDGYQGKIAELLSGTFHEIKDILRIITLAQVDELYSIQVVDAKLRKKLGLP
jgi:hypothetical protein